MPTAKKDEAQRYEGIVDAVLTFDELGAWLKEKKIVPEKKLDQDENSKARFFPTTGGILKTMKMENPEYTYMAIAGTKKSVYAEQLKLIGSKIKKDDKKAVIGKFNDDPAVKA